MQRSAGTTQIVHRGNMWNERGQSVQSSGHSHGAEAENADPGALPFGGSMVDSDRLNVPAIDNSSH